MRWRRSPSSIPRSRTTNAPTATSPIDPRSSGTTSSPTWSAPAHQGRSRLVQPGAHACRGQRLTRHPANGEPLQVSSAFGRAMESVDRTRVVTAIYPALLAALDAGGAARPRRQCRCRERRAIPSPPTSTATEPVGVMRYSTQARRRSRFFTRRAPRPALLAERLVQQAWTKTSATDRDGRRVTLTSHTKALPVPPPTSPGRSWSDRYAGFMHEKRRREDPEYTHSPKNFRLRGRRTCIPRRCWHPRTPPRPQVSYSALLG